MGHTTPNSARKSFRFSSIFLAFVFPAQKTKRVCTEIVEVFSQGRATNVNYYRREPRSPSEAKVVKEQSEMVVLDSLVQQKGGPTGRLLSTSLYGSHHGDETKSASVTLSLTCTAREVNEYRLDATPILYEAPATTLSKR